MRRTGFASRQPEQQDEAGHRSRRTTASPSGPHRTGRQHALVQHGGVDIAHHRLRDDLVTTRAFNYVLVALGMPKVTDADKVARAAALEDATKRAIEAPLAVMRAASRAFPLLRAMAEHGLPASASDGGVGAICARAAVRGAWLNVRTNATGLKDRTYRETVLEEGTRLEADAAAHESAILELVESRWS
jgi:glutamate formiminotransferase/formiminotetrahydrofolate cyclodeaminase